MITKVELAQINLEIAKAYDNFYPSVTIGTKLLERLVASLEQAEAEWRAQEERAELAEQEISEMCDRLSLEDSPVY